MSYSAQTQITIEGIAGGKKECVIAAICEGWDPDNVPPEDYGVSEDDILLTGWNTLYGGESAGEFACRVAVVAWKANGGFCPIWVNVHPEDDPPCDTIEFTEEDYEEMRPGEGIDEVCY
jgi:hypothetical protein